MAYGNSSTYGYQSKMSATFVPGFEDDYSRPPAPELVSPEPQRINPEMQSQIAEGIEAVKNLDLNAQTPGARQSSLQHHFADEPTFSPFPKLVNPPPNVPPSDAELESTLENARSAVLISNDADMQLAWAADALVYVGVCADYEERTAAARPQAARPATPRIEHTLKVDAMNIVNFLADQHHPKAEFLKGMWLEWGRFGQREDKKEAFRCYSRAADRGYTRAQYRIGMLYESYNDPARALKHYYQGVDAGDAACCYRLGMMTLRGQHGQPQDYAKAIDLIKRSANAADENAAQGAYVYGMLLARQLPQIEAPESLLPYNEQQARINIEKAAYLKFAKAQLKMGSAYELASLGCDFNPALSMHYNALASKQGEAEADMALSKWFLVGSEGLFPKNEELAYTYAERAAQNGLATAEFALGYFCEIGVYVPVDLEKALEWYHKAAKHGNEDAAARVDALSRKQALSRKDHDQIAVSRIRSQHGSMRGKRPDRFRQQQASSLGGISETAAGPSYGNGVAAQAPIRGRTPYPEENGPPVIAPLDNRPTSVTPYPVEDGPPKPPPAGGFLNVGQQPPRPATTINPEMRPSSAFHFNPDYRPNFIAAPQQTGPAYNGAPMQQYAGAPPAGSDPRFRPAPPPSQPYNSGPPRPPMASRIASGPAQMQPYQAQQGPQPGFPQKKPVAGGPMQAPSQAYGGRPPQERPRPPPQPQPQPQQQPGPRPQPQPSRPQTSNGRIASVGGAVRPATQQPPQQQRPSAAVPPVPKPTTVTRPGNAAAAPSAASKPAKGPKTFDEMGVPATKKGDDCVVM